MKINLIQVSKLKPGTRLNSTNSIGYWESLYMEIGKLLTNYYINIRVSYLNISVRHSLMLFSDIRNRKNYKKLEIGQVYSFF